MKDINIRLRLLYKYFTFYQKTIFEIFYFKWIYYILKIDNYEIDKYIEERFSNLITKC